MHPTLDLMTTAEVARELRMGERTIKRWRLEGTGPKYSRVGRRVFYARRDVQAWFERQSAA